MTSNTEDILAGAVWECASCAPGLFEEPQQLQDEQVGWLAASVPGTAAGAMRASGAWTWGVEDEDALDGSDWWFRVNFDAPSKGSERWELSLGGLATIADVWLNGNHLLHSENMFVAHRILVEQLDSHNEITIRISALSPILSGRHPRPRWKSRLVRSQSLRWYRTTLLGRVPGWSRWAAPVGPWRPVTLTALDCQTEVLERRMQSRCDGDGGLVSAQILLRGTDPPPKAVWLCVGDERARLELQESEERTLVTGSVRLERVERWWPHTHGDQHLYPAWLDIDGQSIGLGSVGFRTLELDRANGAFTLLVNGLAIFCRGACWGAPDAVSFASAQDDLYAAVSMARDAGMNMLRVPGYATYEDDAFWDACDELGVLVWQDCMLASVDPPEEDDFVRSFECELRGALAHAEGRPALGVVCGSSETYQQAAMLGLPAERWQSRLLEQTIPGIVAELLPEVPYVPSSPSGGEMPFNTNVGVTHYFGVGAYMRPISDARLANVRFAAECLSFATPPERETVEEVFGSAALAGHDPRWKSSVARDAGMSWDFEDIRDHYVREIFGVDPLDVRYTDPERALDLGRAVVAETMTRVLSDWRRRDSPCAGAIVLTLRDLWPGAGWGLLDSLGRPKAPWYALKRVFAPRAVLITDEGLSGLYLHVFNDKPEPLQGRVRVTVFTTDGAVLESAEQELEIPPHDVLALGAQGVLGGFRDLTDAYRFVPSAYDVVLAEIEDSNGKVIGQAVHLPGGAARPQTPYLELQASVIKEHDGTWSLTASSRLFAQYVAVDMPGFTPSDSWFHLPAGRTRTVSLHSTGSQRSPAGTLRALNGMRSVRVRNGEHDG